MHMFEMPLFQCPLTIVSVLLDEGIHAHPCHYNCHGFADTKWGQADDIAAASCRKNNT